MTLTSDAIDDAFCLMASEIYSSVVPEPRGGTATACGDAAYLLVACRQSPMHAFSACYLVVAKQSVTTLNKPA